VTQQIIVSGVSRGLGAAMFECLMKRSVVPIGIARRVPDTLRAAAKQGRCKIMECDLSVPDEISKLDFGSHMADGATAIVFISNAGVVEPVAPVGRIDSKRLIDAFMVNVVAPAIIANNLAGLAASMGVPFKAINIGSGASSRPIPGWSAYCAGKAAAQMFFDCLAAEPSGATAETIDPGVIDTGMQEAIRRAPENDFPDRAEFIRLKQDGVLQDPDVVARDILSSQGLI
jgi:NAD(P)-dependent dehydrogenase (short-subunit alcohol dehydrogenase family)